MTEQSMRAEIEMPDVTGIIESLCMTEQPKRAETETPVVTTNKRGMHKRHRHSASFNDEVLADYEAGTETEDLALKHRINRSLVSEARPQIIFRLQGITPMYLLYRYNNENAVKTKNLNSVCTEIFVPFRPKTEIKVFISGYTYPTAAI